MITAVQISGDPVHNTSLVPPSWSRMGGNLWTQHNLLLCFQLWLAFSTDLQRSLFEHFLELAKDHNSHAKLLCDSGIVRRVCQFLLISASSDNLDSTVLMAAVELLKVLLRVSGKSTSDLLRWAYYSFLSFPWLALRTLVTFPLAPTFLGSFCYVSVQSLIIRLLANYMRKPVQYMCRLNVRIYLYGERTRSLSTNSGDCVRLGFRWKWSG